MPSVNVKQLPPHECWILDTAQWSPRNAHRVQEWTIAGTALRDTLWVASDLIAISAVQLRCNCMLINLAGAEGEATIGMTEYTSAC